MTRTSIASVLTLLLGACFSNEPPPVLDSQGDSSGSGPSDGTVGGDDGTTVAEEDASGTSSATASEGRDLGSESGFCGDGVVDDGEGCDDGNDDDTDGCPTNCMTAACGDGYVWAGAEGCDDGNDDNTDGCLTTCVVATTCAQILEQVPGEPSGEYMISPDDALFVVQCDMESYGGGWTLTFNEASEGFSPTDDGVSDNACYTENCVNLAYSTVELTSDLMFDVSDDDLVGPAYSLRSVVSGVDGRSTQHTMQQLLSTPGPWPVELEDNSNVENDWQNGDDCETSSWTDYAFNMCGSSVLTFYDLDGCGLGIDLGIGSSNNNCGGWPQRPSPNGPQIWPNNFRIWVR